MSDKQSLRVIALLNRDGGTLKTADFPALTSLIDSTFEAAGHAVTIRVTQGSDLIRELDKAAKDETFDVVLAGGGDGTVSAAAAACFRHGHVLGVLPAGTMNFYARTLGIPLGLEDAVKALASGRIRKADIATANGRPFVHQFSVGMQSRMVREREKMVYRSRTGKIIANMRAMMSSIVRPPTFPVTLDIGEAHFSGRRSLVAISNNPHGPGHLPFPDMYDAGVLGLYEVPAIGAGAAVRLVADMATGAWDRNPDLSIREVGALTLHFPRRKRHVHASLDGELIDLEADVAFAIHPGGLKVLVPGR